MPMWNKDQQKVYDTLIALHADKGSELYNKDGSQRGGANVRCFFWHGYNGTPHLKLERTSMLVAAVAAGKECRRRAGGRPAMDEAARPKVRSVRLDDARWAKYQTLGRGWLEAAIDAA